MRNLLILLCAASAACGGDDSSSPCEANCGDAQADSSNSPDAVPLPQCGTSPWLTYGHDPARTFASDACIHAPLTPSWTYTPTPPSGQTVNAVHHALAAVDAVYLQWAASNGPYVGTVSADLVTPAGANVWTFAGAESDMGHWASVSGSSLVVNDDGVYYVDLKTGMSSVGTGVDWWGQSIADGAGGVWLADNHKSDGPGLFVAELDAKAMVVWKQNEQGTMCGQGLTDQMGGIANDGGVLFYAPLYVAGAVQPKFASGLYAFDAVTGTPKWNVPTTPASVISAGNGLVYGIEADAVVARSQKDGSKAWSQPLPGAGAQAPVLANGLAIAAGMSRVSAFDAKSGAPAWSTPITGAAASAYQSTTTNGCAGTQEVGAAIGTSMAAAVPSGTLVVTASDGIHLLSLATGQDQWHGPVPGAQNAVHDPVLVGNVVYVADSPLAGRGGYGPGQLIALKGS